MDNIQMPPIPFKRNMSYGIKILILGLQCGVLMIGALAIWIISYSREERNKDVAEQITSEWGKSVSIDGPIVKGNPDSKTFLRPETFICKANVNTKSLHRNIYEAEVFNTHVTISGTFNKDSIISIGNTIYLELGVNTDQITKISTLKIGNQTIKWRKSNSFLYAEADVSDLPPVIDYSTDFEIRGSGAFFIKQIGNKSFISISGEASCPSFSGSNLPNERSIQGRFFSAKWETDNTLTKTTDEVQPEYKYICTNFLVGVDRYQKVARSLKYAFIIILLTYISVLFTEILMERNIPLLNYFLIGAALIIFYTLLLSFSEHISFGSAYLAASTMTVLLISGYMWKMIGSKKAGIIIGTILTVIYVCCFILLSLETYALLLGSLILFISLATMMYGSIQIKRN